MSRLEPVAAGHSGRAGARSTCLPDGCANCMASHLAICSDLDDEQMIHLSSLIDHMKVTAGRMIFQECDDAVAAFTVTSGVVKQYKLLSDGRRQIIGFHFAGDLIGLPRGATYPATAEAVTDVTLCRFPRKRLSALMDDYPALEKRLLAKVRDELQTAQEQMLLLGRKTAQERIATFLLHLSDRAAPGCLDADGRLTLHMSRGDIADYLGLTTETVSRCFTRLRKAGVIQVDAHGHIAIVGHEHLEALSGSGD